MVEGVQQGPVLVGTFFGPSSRAALANGVQGKVTQAVLTQAIKQYNVSKKKYFSNALGYTLVVLEVL